MYTICAIDDNRHDLDKVKSLLENNFECRQAFFFNDPEVALKDLNGSHVDLFILDINMPGLDGFEFLRKIDDHSAEVVFSTAEDRFALRAYENFALGYLLKPYTESDFVTVISKAIKRIRDKDGRAVTKSSEIISIPTQGCLYVVPKNDVVRMEKIGSYVKFFVNDGNVHLSSRGIKYYLDSPSLDPDRFIVVHKSHVVNIDYVLKYYTDGTLVLKNGDRIPVARRRRDVLLSYLRP